MAKLAARALTLVKGTPDEDPFIPEVAAALLSAGFPVSGIPWLTGDQALQCELSAAMRSAQNLHLPRCACDRNGPCRYPLCRIGTSP